MAGKDLPSKCGLAKSKNWNEAGAYTIKRAHLMEFCKRCMEVPYFKTIVKGGEGVSGAGDKMVQFSKLGSGKRFMKLPKKKEPTLKDIIDEESLDPGGEEYEGVE